MTLTYIQELKTLFNSKSHGSNASNKIFSIIEIILNCNYWNVIYVKNLN